MKKIIFTFIVFAFFANVSAQLKVNSLGQVGIGTASPQSKLDVAGTLKTNDILTTKVVAYEGSSSYDGKILNHYALNWVFDSWSSSTLSLWQSAWGGMRFFTGGLPRLSIRNDGNIGIGSTNPQYKLDVAGTLKTNDILTTKIVAHESSSPLGGNTLNHYALNWLFDTSLSSSALSLWQSSWGGMKFFTAGAPRLYIRDNGKVGIGKDPTAGLLDVAGDIAINGTVKVSSDERLKTEIKPLSDEKYKLYLLQGKSYKKTLPPTGFEEFSSGKIEKIEFPEYGYLAQELKEVFPDLVSQDSIGYYLINYIGLIPVIVEAMKDQQLEIEKQQEMLDELVGVIKELRTEVNELKRDTLSSIFLRSATDETETTGITDVMVTQCKLYQNVPNPFSQNTQIKFYIPENIKVAQLCIYNLQGTQIKQILIAQRGESSQWISGSELRAGMYLYALIVDGKEVDTKRMILTK